MDDEISLMSELQHHVFSTADAYRCGYDDRTIRREVDRRSWVRIRRGYYVLSDVWAAASGPGRHLLVARAVVRPLAGRVALSHTTGAVALGVEHWRPNLSAIHLTRLDGRGGGIEHGVVHHEVSSASAASVRIDADFVVVPAPVAVVGAMMLHSVDQSVVIGDSAVRQSIAGLEAIGELAEAWQRTARTRHVRLAVRLVDGRAASVGESLGRQLFWLGNLPRPELQFEVRGPLGRTAYTDYAWEERRVVGEFDGVVKYQRSLRAGESPSDAVVREKKREEWIVETGLTVRWLIWSELFTPQVTVERFRRALDAGRRHIA